MNSEGTTLQQYPKPLSREELAELLGVHPATIQRWDNDGLIRTVWYGGKKRIPPSEVHRIIECGVDLGKAVTR